MGIIIGEYKCTGGKHFSKSVKYYSLESSENIMMVRLMIQRSEISANVIICLYVLLN